MKQQTKLKRERLSRSWIRQTHVNTWHRGSGWDSASQYGCELYRREESPHIGIVWDFRVGKETAHRSEGKSWFPCLVDAAEPLVFRV